MKYITLLAAALFCSMAATAQQYTVSGYITDGKSAETIIGATVYDENSHHGTASNNFGFYSLTLAAGQHSIAFSYVGYNRQVIGLNLRRDTVININLSSDIELAEVVVTAKSRETGIESTKMGSIDIPVKLIEHTPSLLGETDVLRTIQLTPGVQQGVGGASTLYVRGGNGDENLILLDGATVYKIDHLFGFFSVFTPEAVKKVTFYKSSFPARYNGRTSSVIDVRTKDGDMNNYHASVSVGLLTSRFNVEGPIKEGKTSFNVSGRTTYAGALAQPFLDDDFKVNYWFYDINLKLNHKFSDADRIYFSLYNGLDKFKDKCHDVYESYGNTDIDDYGADLRWRNFIPSLRWNHVFSSKLFANATINYNHYKMRMASYDNMEYLNSNPNYPIRKSIDQTSSDYRSEIKDIGAIVDFDWMPLPAHTVKFGANYTRHNFEPETTSSSYKAKDNDVTLSDTTAKSKGTAAFANEISVYIDDDWKVADNLNLNVGLAHTVFNLKNKTYQNLQPRVSLKYNPVDFLTIKASYSRMTQCVHLLTSSPLSMPTDLWVPITDELEPEVANQYSLGAYYTKIPGWEFSIEGYYKVSDNVLEYKDGMSFAGFSGSWEKLVASGRGESKGLEFMAQKTEGVVTGLVSYTLSKTDRQFSRLSGVNDGERFPFTYDRRHNLNLVVNWQVNDHIFLDVSWSFQSGACATLTETYQEFVEPDNQFSYAWRTEDPYNRGGYHKISDKVAYVPGRNNYRLPCSHVMCAGVDFHKQKKRCERIFNVSVYNLYNYMNPTMVYAIDYDEYGNVGGPRRYRIKKLTILPLIPSCTLTYKF
ncbi:MAG: TonB-dependent receptor [Salinivirgaceae bacterium]|nr:TonB-dependent receptor [Salinivirgaceae bacterium]